MMRLIDAAGNAAAVLGVLACAVAGFARLAHTWSLEIIDTPALFLLGIGLMVFACLTKLQALTENQRTSGSGKQR